MAISFPASPNIGDTITDATTGAVWVWDGIKWTHAAGGGGGGGAQPPFGPPEMTATTGSGDVFVLQGQPTINQPRVIGVTDGSNAASGHVGEYLFINGPTSMQVVTGQRTILSLVLPVGDWDVTGYGLINASGSGSGSAALWIDTSGGFYGLVIGAAALTAGIFIGGYMGPIRYSGDSPMTVDLVSYTPGGVSMSVGRTQLMARRVR